MHTEIDEKDNALKKNHPKNQNEPRKSIAKTSPVTGYKKEKIDYLH